MAKLTFIAPVVVLSAALVVSGCGSKRNTVHAPSGPHRQMHAEARAEPVAVPDSTVRFIRNASFEKVYLDERGRVVRFVPTSNATAEGVEPPPANTPLEYVKYNAQGEIIDWRVAGASTQPE